MRLHLALLILPTIFVNFAANAESGSFALQSSKPRTTQMMRNNLTAKERARIDRALQKCTQQTYSCDYRKKAYPDLQNTQRTISSLMRPLFTYKSAVDNFKLDGARMHSYILRKFEETATAKKYSDCQKVCYSGCMTNTLIEFDNELFERFEKTGERDQNVMFQSVERKLREGKGVCTDFSRLSHSLIKTVASISKVLIINDASHALVEVELNNRKYMYEPQASVCAFFPSPY